MPYDTVTPLLPDPYAHGLRAVYDEVGAVVIEPDPATEPMPEAATVDTRIEYEFEHAVLVVAEAGADVVDQWEQTIADLNGTELLAMYVDLPLRSPHTPAITEQLWDAGFILAGLWSRLDRELDHLRLQRPLVALDPDAIVVYSELAQLLKDRVVAELQQEQMALA